MKLPISLAILIVLLASVAEGQVTCVADTAGTGTISTGGAATLVDVGMQVKGSVLAPFRYGDRLYFTATVPDEHGTGLVSKIYTKVPGQKAVPVPFNPKDSDQHAAHAVMNVPANKVYYTLYREGSGTAQSEICYRNRKFEGGWDNLVKPLKPLNVQGFATTQPACGYDPISKKELLYFSSNRPGGKGGFDIWCCTVERDGTFGNPINLPFNTAANEVTPSCCVFGNQLFFSSDAGGGLGGYDVYTAKIQSDSTWGMPNLLASVNSPFDDLYFTYHQPSRTAYLSSNRPTPHCGDATAGCEQFSVFELQPVAQLNLRISNQDTGAELYGCNVELEDLTSGLIETTLLALNDAAVTLPLNAGKQYRLIVSRAGFFPVFVNLGDIPADFTKVYNHTVALQPMR